MNWNLSMKGIKSTTGILIWALFVTCIFNTAGKAQEHANLSQFHPLKFSHISSKDGLPQNSVLTIHQDENGFLWMGTDDGLARFDGYQFRVFRHSNDKSSLSNNVIRAIISDPLGNIWIGTEGGGINIFDSRNESFIQIESDFSSLEKTKISDLLLTKDYRIIAATNGNGIFEFQLDFSEVEDAQDYLNSLNIRHYNTENSNLSDNKIWALHEDKYQHLWIGTLEGGAQVMRNDEKDFSPVYLIDKGDTISSVKSFFEDKDNNFWIGTEKSGVFLVKDQSSMTLEKILLPCDKNHTHTAGLNITSFQQDDNGNIWIGTLGEGLLILDYKSKKVNHYEDEPNNPYSLNGNSVYSQFKDRSGIIWLGMYSGEGLNKVSPNQQQFEHIRYDPNLQRGLSGKMVKSIYKDSKGNLWVGLFNGGLNLLKNNSRHFQYITKANSSILSNDNVQAIFERSNGDIWIGTDGGGISVINSPNGKPKFYKNNPNNSSSIKKNEVWSIVEDPEGYLWIGTANGGGLHRFDPKAESFKNFKHLPEDPNSPLFNDVRTLLVDSKNNLWIGTYGGGLSKMNLSNQHFTHFLPDDESTDSISHGIITSLMEDQKGYIWVGTFGGGLNRINPLDGKIKVIREKDGLPSDIVKAILEDDNGQIWISTVNGLSSINPDDLTFKNYSEEDGLQSDEFNLGSAFKDETGKLFFGGINGLNSFYPDKINPYPSPHQPILTKFLIFNREILPNQILGESIILNQSINFTEKLSLNFNHNSFEFEFSSLEFLSQDRIRYYYRLKGYDIDWIQVDSKRRFATYSNLEPGNYEFQIKSAYEGDLSFSPVRTLDLEILPPWYLNNYAISLYLLIFLLSSYGIKSFITWRYKLRNDLKLERLEKEKQEEINQLKIRFFTNISHELRTPLMLIKSPLENLVQRKDLPPTVSNQLLSINSNAGRLLRLINQILDFRKQETGHLKLSVKKVDIRNFLAEIKKNFEVIAEQNDVKFSLDTSGLKSESFWIDPEQMEKVFSNLIYNAFKFTPKGKEIEIQVRDASQNIDNKDVPGVEVLIIDSGKGIPEEHLAHIFDRFFQVKQPNIYYPNGTGIGLALSKNLVEFHRGIISVSSIPNQKTIFSVWIRNGFEHFEKHELVNNEEDSLEFDWIQNQLKLYSAETAGKPSELPEVITNSNSEHVMIVEDNPELLHLISMALSKDFQVYLAANGKKALEILQENEIDFIVSDVMMPEMDGIELCGRVKSKLETSHIPFLMLTAKSSHDHQMEGYEAGADDFISKPFELSVLVKKIKNLLNTRDTFKNKYFKSPQLEPSTVTFTNADDKFFKEAINIIESHMDDEEFGVPDLVKELGLSRTLVFEKFKALIGQTPNEFIQTIRLKRAAQMLLDSNLKISEIAYQVGFSNPKYFTKMFQKQFGVVPSKYKNKPQAES